jgi:hypothetical protein
METNEELSLALPCSLELGWRTTANALTGHCFVPNRHLVWNSPNQKHLDNSFHRNHNSVCGN